MALSKYSLLSLLLICVSLVNAQSPKLVLQRGHKAPVLDMSISEDSKFLVSNSWDGEMKLWDLSSGRELRTFGKLADMGTKAKTAFHQDNLHFVSGAIDGTVRLWNIEETAPIRTISTTTKTIGDILFTPKSNEIIVGGDNGMLLFYDMNTGNKTEERFAHEGNVTVIQKSPNKRYILSGGDDGKVNIWDEKKGKKLKAFIAHIEKVEHIAISPDSKKFVSYGNNTLILWDLKKGIAIKTITKDIKMVKALHFSPDGKAIVAAVRQGQIFNWDLTTGNELPTLQGLSTYLNYALFSPNTNQIIINSANKIIEADYNTGKPIRTFEGFQGNIYQSYFNAAVFSPNNKNIVTGGGQKQLWHWGETTARILDVKKGINKIKYSEDGLLIAAATMDKSIQIWDATYGNLYKTLNGHSKAIVDIAFIKNDEQLISLSEDKALRIWDVKDANVLVSLTGIEQTPMSLAVSKNENLVAAGDAVGKIWIWDITTGDTLHTLRDEDGLVLSLSFSPDNTKLLSGQDDGNIRVWDINTGQIEHKFQAQSLMALCIKYSPNGNIIAVTGQDNDIKIFDADSYDLIDSLIGHEGSVNAVDFSSDGKYLTSVSFDQTMRIWDMTSSSLLATTYTLGNKDWATITPNGWFDASPNGMSLLHYTAGTEPISLNQLKERYYEPDLLQKILGFNEESLREVNDFESVNLYPEATFEVVANSKINIKLKPRNGGIGKVSIFINQKEIIEDANPNRTTEIIVDLLPYQKFIHPEKQNNIGIKVYNADGWLHSVMKTIPLNTSNARLATTKKPTIKLGALRKTAVPNFYALIIGTSDYRGNELDLTFADKDAKDMANALQLSANQLFSPDNVHIKLLNTESKIKPSKANILKAFQDISENASPEDVFLVYLAGHGLNENGQFYYLTKDIATGDLSDIEIRDNYAISSDEFTEAFKQITSDKQILILDACKSGKLAETLLTQTRNISSSQRRALERLKDRTGMFVLAGSASDQVSYEASQFGQGLLTYSLLSGMRGAALRENEFVDVMQLFQYAADKVPEFAAYIGGVQRPVITAPMGGSNSFDIGQVTEELSQQIPLEEVKPVFVRSSFQEETAFADLLNLGELLDNQLFEIASDAATSNMVFVDINKYPNAYAVKGRYKIADEEVSITAKVYQGSNLYGEFTLSGDSNDIHYLVHRVLDEIQTVVNKEDE